MDGFGSQPHTITTVTVACFELHTNRQIDANCMNRFSKLRHFVTLAIQICTSHSRTHLLLLFVCALTIHVIHEAFILGVRAYSFCCLFICFHCAFGSLIVCPMLSTINRAIYREEDAHTFLMCWIMHSFSSSHTADPCQ